MKRVLGRGLLTLGCALWLAGPWAAALAQDALTPGGTVTVDGHVLEHHFARKGNAMLFPVEDMARALGKQVQISGDSAVWDGKPAAHIELFDGVAYAPYLTVTEWVPGLQFGATKDRAVFETHLAASPGLHPKAPAGANNGGTPVQVVGVDMLPDQNRANMMTAEATFINSTSAPMSGVKVSLQIIDVDGVTGDGKTPKGYAQYDQTIGDLAPGQAKKLTFETSIANPQNINTASQTFSVDVSGYTMASTTTVNLKCQFIISADKPH